MGSPRRHVPSSARAPRHRSARLDRLRPPGRARRGPRAVWATVAVSLALAGGPLAAVPAGGAPSAADRPTVDAAAAWLRSQQQADGGFEVAGFAGFETPDAVLALAEAAQTGSTWDADAARAAVAAVTTGGKSPLDALDAFASSGLDVGQAAKLIVLTAVPLGLDPAAFDPAGDGSPVDLVAVVRSGAQPDGTYGSAAAFTQTLYAALALRLVDGSVPAATVDAVRSRQQANGGWNFSGDPSGSDVDPDTTSLAVQALIAGGAGVADPVAGDPAVEAALGLLADEQRADGSWASPFDDGNPNSTAMAMLAIAAAGFDPDSAAWRNRVAPVSTGSPYASPSAYLRSVQAPDGHLASPNDSFPPVNTFATAQGIQGLSRGWLPVVAVVLPVGPVEVGPNPGPGVSRSEPPIQVAGARRAVPVAARPSFTG